MFVFSANQKGAGFDESKQRLFYRLCLHSSRVKKCVVAAGESVPEVCMQQ